MLKQLALTTALIASFGTAHAYQAEINANYENTALMVTVKILILLA
jgi:hypothetical protein